MGDSEEPLSESLEELPTIRSQRRFLEIMSLVCTVYYWFHVTIPTRSALGGWPVVIGSARYALTALWIALLWAAWRYCQQLYRLSRSAREATRKDFRAEVSRLSIRIVRRYLLRLPPEQRAALFGHKDGSPHFQRTAEVQRFNFDRDARRFDTQRREIAPKLPAGPLGRESHSVIYTTFDWMHNDAGPQVDYEFGIGRAQFLRLKFRAAVAAALMRPTVFDYVTPLLLLVVAVASLILRTLNGPAAAVCV